MKVLLSFLVLIFFFTNAQAQEIEATLGGNTSTDGFSVKVEGGDTLFRVGGDGNVGIGTTSQNTELDVFGGAHIGTLPNVTKSPGRLTVSGSLAELDIQDRQSGVYSEQDRWVIYNNNQILRFFRGNFGDAMVINPSGNVGIGTTSPNYTLDVSGTIGGNGMLYHSDIRWKKNVQSLTNSLDKIKRLRGVNFEWRLDEFAETNFSEGKQVGMIAQEVEEVIPELVNTASDGYKSVDYAKLVSVLIEAMKEQQKQIEDLESRINSIALKELDRESYGYIKTSLNNLKNFYSVMR